MLYNNLHICGGYTVSIRRRTNPANLGGGRDGVLISKRTSIKSTFPLGHRTKWAEIHYLPAQESTRGAAQPTSSSMLRLGTGLGSPCISNGSHHLKLNESWCCELKRAREDQKAQADSGSPQESLRKQQVSRGVSKAANGQRPVTGGQAGRQVFA